MHITSNMIVAKFNFFFCEKANDKKNLKNNFSEPHKNFNKRTFVLLTKEKGGKCHKVSFYDM